MFFHKDSQRFNNYFELALYVICLGAGITYAIQGNYAKCFQAALIITVLLLFRGLLSWTKSELSAPLRGSILLFITITMLLANLFNMYAVIPYLDKIEHLLSGVILFFVGLFLYDKLAKQYREISMPKHLIIGFALFFSVAMAGVWEIYEFTLDQLLGTVSQNNSLHDTMGDIICGTVGALVTVFYQYFITRRKTKTS